MAESDANANEAGDAVAIQGADDVAEGGDAGGQEQQQPQRQGGWAIVKTLVIRGLIIYAISSFFRRSPSKDAAGGGAPGGSGAMRPATNIYLKDTVMDLYVYVSEQENFDKFDDASLFWKEEDLVYGDWLSGPEGDGTFYKKAQLPISEAVQNNGSLYMHTYIVKAGLSPNPKDGELYSAKHTLYRTRQMNKFKKRKFHSSKNLLTGETEVHPDLIQKEKNSTFEILSFWHPNLTINIIDDQTPWSPGAVPAPLDEFIEFLPTENSYKPILYFNDYWNLNSDMHPINSTTPVLNLSLTYYPMTLFKWQMYAAQGMKSKWYSFMGDDMMEESDDDQDSIKTALVETNPYLLGLTIVVSMIHSVFEFLAFKNDIQFWRNRKSLEGLSVRSVFFSVFQSLIVVLYVMDNETNFVVRCSVVVGLAIEVWKITKVTNVQLDRENKLLGIFPRLVIIDKATYTESMTKEYDTLAFKYLSWLLFPLLGCYAVYSLFYVEHRGWYSWILGMMYGFLLTFGFIMMTPQLFINYKLKSVAHLPWRMLTYKALNTFIDDLFAFVIKMPTLYRLGCFRDDIIFVIYVYQRYIYRVDPKRMNEFGTSGDMHEQNGEATQPIEAEPQASIEPKPDQDKKDD